MIPPDEVLAIIFLGPPSAASHHEIDAIPEDGFAAAADASPLITIASLAVLLFLIVSAVVVLYTPAISTPAEKPVLLLVGPMVFVIP
jgi:hypothetical protein